MRIADFLNGAGDDGFNMSTKRRRGETSGDSVCSSPRSVLSRWLSSLKRVSRESSSSRRRVTSLRCEERRDDEWGRERKGNEGEQCSTNGAEGGASSSRLEGSARPSVSVGSSGRYMKELSFNLGLGIGLTFLIAANKNEFSKMTELQMQMENLLKEVKEEMQKKDVISEHSGSNDNLAHSTTDFSEVGSTNHYPANQNCASFHHVVETEIMDQCSKSFTPTREERVVEMDQLEAELEAELERLQLSLDTEDLPKHPQQQQGQMVVENSTPTRCLSASLEEVDPWDAENCGVSPKELERRLHELLEARQQERIVELESALECAKQNLHEKEMEISWWKDAAQLISQHAPEATRLSW